MPRIKAICVTSPTGHHVIQVDGNNLEVCLYCDYQKQQPPELMQPAYYYNSIFESTERDLRFAAQVQKSFIAGNYC
jgi:hypothetical protein